MRTSLWNDRSYVFVIDTGLLLAALGLRGCGCLQRLTSISSWRMHGPSASRDRRTGFCFATPLDVSVLRDTDLHDAGQHFVILRNLFHLAFDFLNVFSLRSFLSACRDASLTCREDPSAAAKSPHLTLCLHYQ